MSRPSTFRLGDYKQVVEKDIERQFVNSHGGWAAEGGKQLDFNGLLEWESDSTIDWSGIEHLLTCPDGENAIIVLTEQRMNYIGQGEWHSWLKASHQKTRSYTTTPALQPKQHTWATLAQGKSTKLEMQIQQTVEADAAAAVATAKPEKTGEPVQELHDTSEELALVKNQDHIVKSNGTPVKHVESTAIRQLSETKQTANQRANGWGIENKTVISTSSITEVIDHKAVPHDAEELLETVLTCGPKADHIVHAQCKELATYSNTDQRTVWYTVGSKGKLTPTSSARSGQSSLAGNREGKAATRNKRHWKAKMKQLVAKATKQLKACFQQSNVAQTPSPQAIGEGPDEETVDYDEEIVEYDEGEAEGAKTGKARE